MRLLQGARNGYRWWSRLTADERRTSARVSALLVVAKASLRRRGLAKTRVLLARVPLGRPASIEPDRTSAIVERIVRGLGGDTTCLQRSLVLVRLLEHAGIPGELRIGVRCDGTGPTFHAWVMLRGVVINDSPTEIATYAPFDPDRLPSSGWS